MVEAKMVKQWALVACLGLGLACGVQGFSSSSSLSFKGRLELQGLKSSLRSRGARAKGFKPPMIMRERSSKKLLMAPGMAELADQIPARPVAKGMEQPGLGVVIEKVKLESWPWAIAAALIAGISVLAKSTTVAAVLVIAELMFFLFCALQARWMDRPAVPEPIARDLTDMWDTCIAETPEIGAEGFLRGWFYDSPLEDISREDLADFISWATFSSTFQDLQKASKDQVNHVIQLFEKRLKHTFPKRAEGQLPTSCMRFTIEPLEWVHKPIIFYVVVQGLLGGLTRITMYNAGFTRHKCGVFKYWMKVPTSEEGRRRVPIVFMHGIGVGLITYIKFVEQLMKNDCPILCVELPFVSSTVTPYVPSINRQVSSMQAILNRWEIPKAVFIGHSYGSVMLSWMVQHAPNRVASVAFIDPVVFLLNLRNTLYNFLYRVEQDGKISDVLGSELYLNYALRRNFWWYRNILWAQDIQDAGVKGLVCVSENDEIAPSLAVEKHVLKHAEAMGGTDKSLVESYMIEGANHGQILFDEDLAKVVAGRINQFWEQTNAAMENQRRPVREPRTLNNLWGANWVVTQARWNLRKATKQGGAA